MKKNKILLYAELFDAFRVVPRLILVGYAVLVWIVVGWYMDLPEPTSQHASLVVSVVGIIAPVAAVYQKSGRKWGDKEE